MNKKRVEKMMIEAMALLNDKTAYPVMFDKKNGARKIHSRFNGYAASFGPSVIHAGLLQTLAFYCRSDRDEESDAEGKDRKEVTGLMAAVLERAGYLDKAEDEKKTLFDRMLARIQIAPGERSRLKSLTMEACAACKLAMRTFPVEKAE